MNRTFSATESLVPPSFPVETWEAIFRNVTKPGDLYNLCLVSRYICNISTPILYSRLIIDQNPYLVFTFAKFQRDPDLMARVMSLTLLPPVPRHTTWDLQLEAEDLCSDLRIPYTPSITHPTLTLPLPEEVIIQRSEADSWLPNMVYFFPRVFSGLTTLKIVGGSLPTHFLSHVFNLPQLVTLYIRDASVPANLELAIPTKPLPLQELSIKGCRTKIDRTALNVPGILAKGLLQNSPSLSSLTIDLFLELAVCVLISNLEKPPPICTFNCQGLSHHDADCALMCSVLTALPTITSLHMARTPRELGHLLPSNCLPNLQSLTGQIKSLAVYTIFRRRVEYITITDAASPSGGIPWETHLILFLEALKANGTELKGLAFNVAEWSEELFLCVCSLWPGLKELSIQCTTGNGVDEYFRISFGPRFLPQLQNLEVLHIFEKGLKYCFKKFHLSKGVGVYTESSTALASLDADELDEIAETPIHLRRWEKINPNIREVAFNREAWWRRLEPGGWVLKRDALPILSEE